MPRPLHELPMAQRPSTRYDSPSSARPRRPLRPPGPTPGNHEYHDGRATAYFAYFGASAGTPGEGYYSYDLGDWHVIALNSNIDVAPGSAQERWLRADLAAHPARCTLAYWHHALFSSSKYATLEMRPLWRAL